MVFRSILSFVLSYCLAMYPVHAKTVSQQEGLRAFVKDSGIGQENMTIAQWIKKNRAYYHPKVAELASQWAAKNPNMKMPQVKMTTFEGENGQETTRLVFLEKKETTTVDINTQGDKVTMSIDGKKYSYNDLYYDGALETAADSSQVTWNELSRIHKLAPGKAANYQVHLRNLVNELTAFYQQVPSNVREVSFVELLIEQAFAAKEGQQCIMGGYSTVMANGSCGGNDKRMTAGCAAETVNCNPNVYGFEAKSGKQFCVKKGPPENVSPQCDSKYPIPANKMGLISSIIKNIDSLTPEKREIAWAEFFKNLDSDIARAGKICSGDDFEFETMKSAVSENKSKTTDNYFKQEQFTAKFPVKEDKSGRDENLHHRVACEKVMNRLFIMDQAKTCVRQDIAQSDAGLAPVKKESSECKLSADISLVTIDSAAGRIIAEPPQLEPAPRLNPVKAEKKSKKWILWLLAGLGAACVFKIICGSKNKKPKPPVYPPIPVGKPGESETPRTGSGGVGGAIAPAPTATTMPLAPARTGVQ